MGVGGIVVAPSKTSWTGDITPYFDRWLRVMKAANFCSSGWSSGTVHTPQEGSQVAAPSTTSPTRSEGVLCNGTDRDIGVGVGISSSTTAASCSLWGDGGLGCTAKKFVIDVATYSFGCFFGRSPIRGGATRARMAFVMWYFESPA